MKDRFNKEALTAYLLGKLSESEAEEFDELSITDDDFADELRLAEDDLVDSYIHGELIDSERERFEAYFLASPLRREKVEFARTLQTVVVKNTAENVKITDEAETSLGFFASIFANFSLAMRLGFAALLLSFIGIFSWILIQNLFNNPNEEAKITLTPTPTPIQSPIQTPTVSPTVEISPTPKNSPTLSPTPTPTIAPTQMPIAEQNKEITPNVPSLATFVLLPPIRGNGSLQTISIPAKTTDVAFGLPLESDDFKSYKVTLANQSGKVLWQSGKLNSKKSALNVRFPANLLQSNIYSFTVSGINETGESENIGNYSFRTVLK